MLSNLQPIKSPSRSEVWKHLPGGFNPKGFRASTKFPLNLMGFQVSSTLSLISGQTSLVLLVTLHKVPSLAQLDKGF